MAESEIREGFLVTDISGANGGISHSTRAQQAGEGLTKTTVLTKDPNPALTRAMKQLVNKADYTCRSLCASTQVGWIIVEERVAELQKQFSLLTEEAEQLNQRAAKLRAARRVRLGVVLSTFVDPSQQFEAVDRATHDGLSTLAELLREGRIVDGKDRSPWRPTMLRMANLDSLLVGQKRMRFDAAVSQANLARQVYMELVSKPGSLRKAAAAMDVYAKQIDAAVSWFVDEGVL